MRIVITGASKGIGLATARKLATEGHELIICSRSQAEITETARNIEQEFSVPCFGYATDLSAKSDVEIFSKTVTDKWGKVDVLVNNAGIFLPGEIMKEEDGKLEQMMNTNLYSAYHLTRALIGPMIRSGKGHIVNICSIASQIAYPNGGSYSISKFALLGFSKVLREEMKAHGVKVTAILPGATWSHSWEGADFPENRLMQAEDIAETISTAINLGPSATIEEIIIRPQLGDL